MCDLNINFVKPFFVHSNSNILEFHFGIFHSVLQIFFSCLQMFLKVVKLDEK